MSKRHGNGHEQGSRHVCAIGHFTHPLYAHQQGLTMNERIKQITGQVLDELVPETWVALGYDKIKEIQNRTAELIVRECGQWVNDNLGLLDEEARADLLKHFGVEE
jgi:hypothetical protein